MKNLPTLKPDSCEYLHVTQVFISHNYRQYKVTWLEKLFKKTGSHAYPILKMSLHIQGFKQSELYTANSAIFLPQ